MIINRTTIGVLTAALAAAALAAASPASAVITDAGGADLTAETTVLAGPNRAVSAVAQIQFGPVLPDRTRTVTWECLGVSVGDAVATRLPTCSLVLTRPDGSVSTLNAPAAYPGPLAAQAKSNTRVAVGLLAKSCTQAQAVWTDNSTKSTGLICTLSSRT